METKSLGAALKSLLIFLFLCVAYVDKASARFKLGGDNSDKEIPAKYSTPVDVLCDKDLENFASTEVGGFPKGWRSKVEGNAEEAARDKLYIIEKDSEKGHVLKGTYGTHTITLLKTLEPWDLAEYPYLEWEWKAEILPTGADERELGKNDSAASVYVVWNVGFPMQAKALRFAWSSTVKEGTFYQRRLKHDNITILESGTENLHKWVKERVNVRELFNKHILLPEDNRKPYALALTTDADATNSKAQAYYANFKLCREVPRK